MKFKNNNKKQRNQKKKIKNILIKQMNKNIRMEIYKNRQKIKMNN